MSDESFNGWPNRETWCASLYLDNDRGSYVTLNVYRHVAIEIEGMVQEWRDHLEEFGAPGSDVEPGLLSMFLEIGSLWRVDWDAIAVGKLDTFPVELLQPKNASHLIENERPIVTLWHFCDWRPVAIDVLGLGFGDV